MSEFLKERGWSKVEGTQHMWQKQSMCFGIDAAMNFETAHQRVKALRGAGWNSHEGRWWKPTFEPWQNTLTLEQAWNWHNQSIETKSADN